MTGTSRNDSSRFRAVTTISSSAAGPVPATLTSCVAAGVTCSRALAAIVNRTVCFTDIWIPQLLRLFGAPAGGAILQYCYTCKSTYVDNSNTNVDDIRTDFRGSQPVSDCVEPPGARKSLGRLPREVHG